MSDTAEYEYYLRCANIPIGWVQVSKDEFIKAERGSGFYPKCRSDDVCATRGFSNSATGMFGEVRTKETSYEC